MRSPALLLDPRSEQEVGRRKITKKQTRALRQPPGTAKHSSLCGEQQPSSFNSRDACSQTTKKCLFPGTQAGAVFWTITHGTAQLSIAWSAVYAAWAYIDISCLPSEQAEQRQPNALLLLGGSGEKENQFVLIRAEMPTYTVVMCSGQIFLQQPQTFLSTWWKIPI